MKFFQNRAASTARDETALPEDTKASRTSSVVQFYEAGHPRWTPRDYSALTRQGFTRNPVAHRCVRLISKAAGATALLLYKDGQELSEHPLLKLLKRPNPAQSGKALMEALYGHLMVAGNAYLEMIELDGEPTELYSLRPDRMRVVPGKDGWPDGFDYHVGGRTIRISRDAETSLMPVLHLKLFHPLDDHYGFSPLEAAQTSLDLHNAASGWNKALLDNAARPSGALVYATKEGANLTPKQFDRLKKELEDGFQGPDNAGRPLLLDGGLDWKPMSLSPKDMDFLEAKNSAAREIALAFGVPPMLLGIPGDNTFSNYQEANRGFWRQTVLPLVLKTCESITAWLEPFYGEEGFQLEPDIDRIEALASERESLWRRVEAASFLTEDEKREAVGYSPKNIKDKTI
jgi:HK97 family phage portal protein